MTNHRITNSQNSEYYHLKLGFLKKSPQINEEFEEYISTDYEPINNKEMHLHHHHTEHKLPHLHTFGCERLITAFDKQREKRYYFTNELTPVRVYIKYNQNQNGKKFVNIAATPTIKENNKFNGVSEKFLKEVTNCRFIEETLSFIPIITRHHKKQSSCDDLVKSSSRSENTSHKNSSLF
jgi:hypothetical protein